MSPKHYGIGGKDGRGRRDTRQVKLCQRRSQKRPQVSASVARAMPDPHVPASSSHPTSSWHKWRRRHFFSFFFFTHGNLLPIRSDLKPRLQDLWWELNAQLQGRKCCAHGVSQDTFFSLFTFFSFFSRFTAFFSLSPLPLPYPSTPSSPVWLVFYTY